MPVNPEEVTMTTALESAYNAWLNAIVSKVNFLGLLDQKISEVWEIVGNELVIVVSVNDVNLYKFVAREGFSYAKQNRL
jgi:hypothetical protein